MFVWAPADWSPARPLDLVGRDGHGLGSHTWLVDFGASETHDSQVDEAVAAELESLSPSCRADPDRLRTLLAPDFHEFGTSGAEIEFEGAAELIAADADPSDEPIRVENLRGHRLADGVVMVKYTSESKGRRSNRTSLWRRVGPGQWQIFHHQGTPAHLTHCGVPRHAAVEQSQQSSAAKSTRGAVGA